MVHGATWHNSYFKLVTEMQISPAWIDSAWPKVPTEKPDKTALSPCLFLLSFPWPLSFSHLSPSPLSVSSPLFTLSSLCNLVLKYASGMQGWRDPDSWRIDGTLLRCGDHRERERGRGGKREGDKEVEAGKFCFVCSLCAVTVGVGVWGLRRWLERWKRTKAEFLSLQLSIAPTLQHTAKQLAGCHNLDLPAGGTHREAGH